MLSKAKYPQLSRVWRRHPERLARLSEAGWGGKMHSNWLLAGLMIRGGYTARVTEDGAQV